MNVLLINPGREHTSKNLDARASAPPLGLLYVASSLISKGHEVKLIDQNGSSASDERVITQAKHFSPDVIGFSTMGPQTVSAGRISNKLKKVLPNTKILWGGINPTFNAERIMKKYKEVDYCIKGEGEIASLELMSALKTKKFSDVHGLVYRQGRAVKHGLERQLIKNLNVLPFPDRALIRDVEYGDLSGLKVKNFTSVLSSRGCPFACKYCCCASLVNSTWRPRSVPNILDELELVQNQGYKMALFNDDSFTINNKRVIELSKGIRERGIKLDWFFEGRVDNADYEAMKWAVKAGAKAAYFGAESANERVLKLYDKRIKPKQVIDAINLTRKAGMDFIVASFILGAPSETKTEVENTIKFMTGLDVDFVQVTNLIAYPGTNVWNELVRKGYLDPEKYWETGVGVGRVHPDSLSEEYLQAKVKEAYSRFINTPHVRKNHVLRLFKSGFRRNVLFQNLKYFDKNVIHKLVGR